MVRILMAFAAGLLFGAGLVLSQMVNPAKVLGFLDLAGDWDPSLAFVMLGAVPVAAMGYGVARRLAKPLCATAFAEPARRPIDRRLAGGAVLFGIGWGLVGLCPGPAIANLATLSPGVIVFVVAMAVGMLAHDLWPARNIVAGVPTLAPANAVDG